MSLIKRPNSNNWYYLFQFQGRRYFGSAQTPKKTLAVKIEAKVREDAISRLVLGEVKLTVVEPFYCSCNHGNTSVWLNWNDASLILKATCGSNYRKN